jgi:hypothetical protein
MRVRVIGVDYEPPELREQVPFEMELLRKITGKDSPSYWLAKLDKPLRWNSEGHERLISYVVITSRWVGKEIEKKMKYTPINISYVVDPTQLQESFLDFDKCAYVAVGIADAI